MGAKRIAFKIPLQSEVQAYMKERKGWPDAFCEYYAARFWNHYQASGWKLSNGNPIKDWMACFNANWQVLKFKDDINTLNRMGGQVGPAKVVAMPVPGSLDSELSGLDRLLIQYTKRPSDFNTGVLRGDPDLALYYGLIKKYRLWPPDMTLSEISRFKDERECKAYVLYRTLDWFGVKGWTFTEFIKRRK